jgi:hypothetical protein
LIAVILLLWFFVIRETDESEEANDEVEFDSDLDSTDSAMEVLEECASGYQSIAEDDEDVMAAFFPANGSQSFEEVDFAV